MEREQSGQKKRGKKANKGEAQVLPAMNTGKLSRPMKETEKISYFGLCLLLKLFKMQVNPQTSSKSNDSRLFTLKGCIELEQMQTIKSYDFDQAGLGLQAEVSRRFVPPSSKKEEGHGGAMAFMVEVNQWTNNQKSEGNSKLIFRSLETHSKKTKR